MHHMASPRAELRLLSGFALMPLAAAAFAFAAYALLWQAGPDSMSGFKPSDPIASAVSIGMAVGLVAVLVTVFGAVPLVMWLLRRGPLALSRVLLAGAILGIAPLAIGILVMLGASLARGTMPEHVGDAWYGWEGMIRTTTVGLFVGVTSAAVFWLVAVRGTELTTRRS